MASLTVANTILQQLGGAGILQAMIGAHSFMGNKDRLTFKIKAKANQGIRAINIILTPADTYTVEFYRIKGIEVKKVEVVEDVYCGELRSVIERVTGLYLSL